MRFIRRYVSFNTQIVFIRIFSSRQNRENDRNINTIL